ncbi:MAG: hypothetical protein ACRDZ8_21155 [Acidimicrobiales bacterium]
MDVSFASDRVSLNQVVPPKDPAGLSVEPPHRATYILERGTWHVTCRGCGWHASGAVRRQLASLFRFHLRVPARETP